MYSSKAGLILGFHGCDESVAKAVVHGNRQLKPSKNNYDWLGHGSYFWESSPSRAFDFASFLSARPGSSISNPAVLGAVIDLGHCLDLLDFENLASLRKSYKFLKETLDASTFSSLQNKPASGRGDDLLLRLLDCAVVESMHKVRHHNSMKPFDSVRAVFWEGDSLYPNAGFREKDHIQICIRNPNCIKGCFLPRTLDKNFAPV